MPNTSQMTPNSNTATTVENESRDTAQSHGRILSHRVSAATVGWILCGRIITAMTALITFLLLTVVLIAPFGVVAAIAAAPIATAPCVCTATSSWSPRPWSAGFTTTDDADARRVEHDLDAIRTRFENAPGVAVTQVCSGSVARNVSTASRYRSGASSCTRCPAPGTCT